MSFFAHCCAHKFEYNFIGMANNVLTENWKWIIGFMLTISGIIYAAGRYTENQVQSMKQFKDSIIELKTSTDTILQLTIENSTRLDRIERKQISDAIQLYLFEDSYKDYLRQNDRITKELYSKLTEGLNGISDDIKKNDWSGTIQ